MKTLITLAYSAISILSFAQTDIVEMRSRNASLKTYERSRVANDFDHVASNFGGSWPDRESRPFVLPPKAFLDSIKTIEKEGVVFFIRAQCEKIKLSDDSMNETPCYTRADTFYNHPLLQYRSSLDSVKLILRRDHSFGLIVDSTQYIDFDDQQEVHSEEIILKEKEKKEKQNSIAWELILMLLTPILFMYAMSRFVIPESSNSE